MDRRNFLKTLGIAGSTALLPGSTLASPSEDIEFMAVLVDTTLCVGCRGCEEICAETNNLPECDINDSDLEKERTTSETQWSVINRYEADVDGGEIFVKKQCMHCNQPACAAACLTKAMYKTEEGPVIWREGKCMGCRFCMLSCPFDVPKFEYNSPNPKIQKCRMCFERLKKGEKPACVENCPAEALLFGTRRELIDRAKTRIYSEPDRYVHHIYGEHEVGGTGFLYLSAVPFEEIGFRTDLGTTAYPKFTKEFLYAVPVILTLFPAFLYAVSNATKGQQDKTESEDGIE